MFLFSDIYAIDEKIIIKNLFISKSKLFKDIIEIDKGIFPFTFYLKFFDGSKIMFFSDTLDILKHIISNDPDKLLRSLKSKLIKENNSNDSLD